VSKKVVRMYSQHYALNG